MHTTINPFRIRRPAVVGVVAALTVAVLAPVTAAGSGGKLVYAAHRNGDHEIYVKRLADGVITRLTRNRSADVAPVWSPNGRLIAFVSNRDGDDEIFVMRPDGTGLRNVTKNAAQDGTPAWSPDGRKIVFTSNRRNGQYDIFVVNRDRTDPLRLTRHAGIDVHPAWSPDGTKIAFTSNRVSEFNPEVFVMNANGSALKRLTFTGGDWDFQIDDTEPEWSPDGTKIAFSSNRDVLNEIYVMNGDGSEQTRVTVSDDRDENDPSWTPDGERLLFSTSAEGRTIIETIGVDGMKRMTLIRASYADLHVNP